MKMGVEGVEEKVDCTLETGSLQSPRSSLPCSLKAPGGKGEAGSQPLLALFAHAGDMDIVPGSAFLAAWIVLAVADEIE